MKKMLTAIALTIAIPAIANAQAAPAPTAKADCCDKMKTMADCKDMAMMDQGKMDHGKMDHSKMGHDMAKMGSEAPNDDTPRSPRN